MLNKLKKYLKKYLQTLKDNHFIYNHTDKVFYYKELSKIIIEHNKFIFIVKDIKDTIVITYIPDTECFRLYPIEMPRNIVYRRELSYNKYYRVLNILE